jgi:sigma-B regulation protein RsbU (phosphoserine phosphatase)
MPTLQVKPSDRAPLRVELKGDVFTIGRASDCDLSIPSLWLSRGHAKILRRGDTYWLQDTCSRNGTFVNLRPIDEPVALADGDEIRLGDVRMSFQLDPESQVAVVQDPLPPRPSDAFVLGADEISFTRYAEESRSAKPGARREADLWPALNAAAATLITHYPLERLLEVVMDIVFRAVPAQRGALMLRRPDAPAELDTRVVRAPAGERRLDISHTIVRQVLDGRRAVLTADALTDGRFERAESICAEGIRSVLCVPLWNEREVIGLIYVDNLVSRRAFSQSDLRLLGLIASMAAVKIENARLLLEQIERARFAEQLQVAAQIQRHLLPQADPDVPGYELRGMSRPCYEIGGDYYDYLWRGGGRLALVVADVSGKGVGAALLMAAFQASLRTLASGDGDPVALVTRLNRAMAENSPESKFVTVFYAELDPARHTLEYVNAGHNPPLCLRGGAVHRLAPTGPVVGLLPGATYRSERIPLAPGELLTLYTDGITECEDVEEQEFGEGRLARFVAEHGRRPLDELSRRLLAALAEFSVGAPRKDDSTLILLRRTA